MIVYLLNVLSRASTALCLKQILVKTVPISLVAPVTHFKDKRQMELGFIMQIRTV